MTAKTFGLCAFSLAFQAATGAFAQAPQTAPPTPRRDDRANAAPADAMLQAGRNQVGGSADNAAATSHGDVGIWERDAPKWNNPVLAAFAAQRGGLTANDVAERAVATSDTIAAKNAELKAAAQAVDTARFQFLPKMGLKASYARLSSATLQLGDGNVVASRSAGPVLVRTMPNGVAIATDQQGNPIGGVPLSFELPNDHYSLSASLGVPLSDYVLRLSDAVDAAKQSRDASEFNLKAERQKVEADARVAFFNWALAIGQVAVTEKSLERVKARQADVLAAHELGAATTADVRRLEALVAATEAGLVSAQSFKQLAEEHLLVIMSASEQQFIIGEDVLAERVPATLRPLNKLVEEANANRYELKALDRAADALRQMEAVTRKGQLPRIDGFADYVYANPNQRYLLMENWRKSWDIGVAASWNVNEVFTAGSTGSELAAKRIALEANRRALAKGIRMEVASAYTEARRHAAALESAKRGAVAAQTAYDSEVELFKLGRATATELIDSESELVNSLLALISAHINIRLAETRLAKATGANLHSIGN